MRMKRILSGILVAGMVLGLCACGNTSTASGSASTSSAATTSSSSSVTTLKFNFVKTSSDPEYKWYDDYFSDIKNASNGTLDYQLYPSEALGGSADVLEMAADGQPVVQDCDFSYLANYVPDFAVAMSPYLIQKPEQIEKFWKSDLGQKLCKELEEKGLHVIDMHYFGTRNLISNKKVTSRDQMSSLKIRCAATPMWNEVVRVLGGNAVNTAWSETYQALSQGVADAAESPMGLLYSSKLYEPCKYLIETNHLVAATTVVMSQKVYESLPDDAKKAIDEIGSAYPAKDIPLVQANEEEYAQKLKDEGVEFVEIDKTPFIEAAQDTPNHFPDWTPGLYEAAQEAIAD